MCPRSARLAAKPIKPRHPTTRSPLGPQFTKGIDDNPTLDLDLDRKAHLFVLGNFGDLLTLNADIPPSGWISDNEQHFPEGRLGPDNPIGYTGHMFDPEIGMYLARFRHYRPRLGRWIQPDPAGYIDGPSVYLFVLSAPTTWVDPLGLNAQKLCHIRKMIKNRCGGGGNGRGGDIAQAGAMVGASAVAAAGGTELGRRLYNEGMYSDAMQKRLRNGPAADTPGSARRAAQMYVEQDGKVTRAYHRWKNYRRGSRAAGAGLSGWSAGFHLSDAMSAEDSDQSRESLFRGAIDLLSIGLGPLGQATTTVALMLADGAIEWVEIEEEKWQELDELGQAKACANARAQERKLSEGM